MSDEHQTSLPDTVAGPHEHRLSDLPDYEIDEGHPDIRGWPARGSNGRELGVIGELLVDTDQDRIVAAEVHLGVGAAGVRGNLISTARVPIESVQLRRDRYVVVDVDVIPCTDVVDFAAEATVVPRIPCGQIGVRRRERGDDGAARDARSDVEVARPVANADASGAPPRRDAPVSPASDARRGDDELPRR